MNGLIDSSTVLLGLNGLSRPARAIRVRPELESIPNAEPITYPRRE
jgi:hypothetical protein